jgi:molybdenum cofactor cytidylyltransferase
LLPESKTGIIILAAGASSRLGKPKQLLKYNGKTLLKHTADEAVGSEAGSVIVVLGAHASMCRKEIDERKITVVENTEWQEGMASSIKTGLNVLLKKMPAADAAILMVCDQPFVSAALLNELMEIHRSTGKFIIASDYGETTGPPALFHKKYFPDLLKLPGDTGARKIIQQEKSGVASVYFPGGSTDIDREEDFKSL